MKKRNQNRNAPAYMEYAASMMARFEYRTLTLEERGLLYTLRLECWVNQNLPQEPVKLAKALGLPIESVQTLLPNIIEPFFKKVGDFLQSPDLEDYRLTVQDTRNAQSEGGRKARQNDKLKRQAASQSSSNLDASNMNLLSKDQVNQVKEKSVFKEDVSHEAWINDYDSN